MPDELLDIVDDRDQVVDRQMRSVVHQRGLQHRGVHVFLFDNEGRMLVQKRSADRASSPSLLDCSLSEHVLSGESYFEAATRGMQEELGIQGIEITPLVKFQMVYGVNDNEISTLYRGKVHSESIGFDRGEIEAVFFSTVGEILEGMQADPSRFCSWFVEMMNWYSDKPSRLTKLKGY